MPILKRTVLVPTSLQEVFSTMADFTTLPEWDPGSVSSQQVSGSGPGVGAEYEVVVRFGGRTSNMRYVTRELDSNQRLVFEGEGSNVAATDTITFREVDGQTEINFVADIRLKGLLAAATPVLKGTFNRLADHAMDGIARRFG